MAKAKAALYWASSCGGCEISVLEIGIKIIGVLEHVDIVFWPCIMDFKYQDVEAMADGEIDVCLFNGAIRNEENLQVAKLLRKKSKLMIAYGACAVGGGIPSLANFYTRAALLDRVYRETPSTDNQAGVVPETCVPVAEGDLHIPDMFDRVYKLDDVIAVDYYLPGCPAVPESTAAVFDAILSGKLPPKGSVVGIKAKPVCDECKRERREKLIRKFYRPQEIIPSATECLLDQGLICMGPATAGGCGAQCPTANRGCEGCYGPPPGVDDQGLKMLSVLASVVDADHEHEIEEILGQIADPAGTFYRFGAAASTIQNANPVVPGAKSGSRS